MLENAFEEWLSSDANRLQALWSKAIQDTFGQYGETASSALISGLTRAPTLSPVAASFSYTLGFGTGFVQVPFVDADNSTFSRVEWIGGQTVVIGTPSGNDRIDIIVATPALVGGDPQSRNILVNPATRQQSVSTVDKTLFNQATISVIVGTPGVTPVPPAVPSGVLPLFEIRVPAGATQASDFFPTARSWRLALNPFSVMNGIVQGCNPMTDVTFGFGSPGNNDPYFIAGDHIIVIDGEIITFTITGALTALKDIEDTSNPPFTGVTVGTADKPYYQYLVGGRNAPVAEPDTTGLTYQPVELVESLTPPNLLTGHPSAPISYSRGTTTKGAIYCGLGFAQKGTGPPALRKPVQMIGDKVYAGNDPFESIAVAGIGPFTFTLASAPPAALPGAETPVSKALVELNVAHPGASASAHRVQLTVAGAQPTEAVMLSVAIIVTLADQIGFNQGEVWWSKFVGPLIDCIGAIAGDTTILRVLAYQHNVKRLDYGAGVVSY